MAEPLYRPHVHLRLSVCSAQERFERLTARIVGHAPGPAVVLVGNPHAGEMLAEALRAEEIYARFFHAEDAACAKDWFAIAQDPVWVAGPGTVWQESRGDVRYLYVAHMPCSIPEAYSHYETVGHDGRESTVEWFASASDIRWLENHLCSTEAGFSAIWPRICRCLQQAPASGLSQLATKAECSPFAVEAALLGLMCRGCLAGPDGGAVFVFRPLRTSAEILADLPEDELSRLQAIFRSVHRKEILCTLDLADAAGACGVDVEGVIQFLMPLVLRGDLEPVLPQETTYRFHLVPTREINVQHLAQWLPLWRDVMMRRLRGVTAWLEGEGCLTQRLLRRVGEPRVAVCGHCSWCLGLRPGFLRQEPGRLDPEEIRSRLRALQELSPGLCAQDGADCLCGVWNWRLAKRQLDRHPLFGCLRSAPWNEVSCDD